MTVLQEIALLLYALLALGLLVAAFGFVGVLLLWSISSRMSGHKPTQVRPMLPMPPPVPPGPVVVKRQPLPPWEKVKEQ